MDQIVRLTELLVWGVIGGAALLVALKAATGQINLRGLLNTKNDGAGVSAARVQLLFFTLIGAFGYLGLAAKSLASCSPDSCSLPDVPTELLAILGGSHAFYLGAKGLITGGWLERLRGN